MQARIEKNTVQNKNTTRKMSEMIACLMQSNWAMHNTSDGDLTVLQAMWYGQILTYFGVQLVETIIEQ